MVRLTRSTGTVTLSGAAEKVVLPASYGWVWVKNMSDSEIIAGLAANISKGSDGVMTISEGECGRVQTDGFNAVYLKGTGSAMVVAQNYSDCPFKMAAKGGEIPDLSPYAKKADVPNIKVNSAVNADTVGGLRVDEIASNPNLLINPDFKINHRENAMVSTAGDFISDRWELISGSAMANDDGTIYLSGSMCQILENAVGGDAVASSSAGAATYDDSTKTFTLTASSENISWCKLEHGSVATSFIAPDPVEELLKCQRYCVVIPYGRYFRASFVGTSVMQFMIPLPAAMANVPSIVSGTMGVIPLNQSTSNQADTSFTFSITGIKNNLITVQATKSNGAIDGALFVTEELVLSAEL